MEISEKEFYKVIAPRVSTLVVTIDEEGRVNCAPFSFIMPVSMVPPILCFASAKGCHTLSNIRTTKEFVVAIPEASIIKELWVTSKPFPKGVNEIKEACLTERSSNFVKLPRIERPLLHISGPYFSIPGKLLKAEE
jgi:flavin reductase (DIM6/NTAB) family NADH-FMN oxidoreductase RutF